MPSTAPADPPTTAPSRLGVAFEQLAAVIYASADYDGINSALVSAAVELVDGCTHASLMLRGSRNDFRTVAATDDVARLVDELERRHHEGPCVDAIIEVAPQLVEDFRTDDQYPTLASAVVARTPVRSAAGFRIVVEDSKVGALNLFSDEPGGLDERSVDQAIVLASFASVALGAVNSRLQAATLAKGLDSNREIGKAVGLMMAFHKVGDDEAFALLRKASQDMNMKIAEVARQVVEHHNRR
ncbi:GAF domain-containing protein [Lapillicoccus jejuensis]|uniref:GAF domain-containing protein n=2 Tax=Lapillicoccus jejuensis TaxID=402171 RepID=A0A542E1P0_9MICO|nr:GAF domain-containing protein [Lapillicoccus jejuensis]